MINCIAVGKKYTDVFVLQNINLQIPKGNLVALTGESGCGKTTLLRLLAGLETLTEGCIAINQQVVADPTTWVKPEKRRVGMVFQDYALFPHLTVAENIAYGLAPKSKNTMLGNEMLDLVGLQGYQKRYPHELSGGQQQRIALARALAPQPEVLLLDEPFSNLDEIRREQLRDELCQIIRQTRITAILVTHDTKDALLTADKVALLRKGQLLQYETPQNLYQRPADSYTALFFGKANLLTGTPTETGLQTALGTFATQKQTISIRPEHLALVNPEITPTKAMVQQISFGGVLQELQVQIQHSPKGEYTVLQVKAPNHLTFKQGEVVGIEVLHWVGV